MKPIKLVVFVRKNALFEVVLVDQDGELQLPILNSQKEIKEKLNLDSEIKYVEQSKGHSLCYVTFTPKMIEPTFNFTSNYYPNIKLYPLNKLPKLSNQINTDINRAFSTYVACVTEPIKNKKGKKDKKS